MPPMSTMPWGKYKGWTLADLPLRYLRWMTKWLRTQAWAQGGAVQTALWAEYGRRVVAFDDVAFRKFVDRCPPELEETVFREYDRRVADRQPVVTTRRLGAENGRSDGVVGRSR
jgi:hypothetical protein